MSLLEPLCATADAVLEQMNAALGTSFDLLSYCGRPVRGSLQEVGVCAGATLRVTERRRGGVGGGCYADCSPAEARRRILDFLPSDDRWPPHMRQRFCGEDELKNKDRISLVTFLYGNGCRSRDISAALAPRLGGKRKKRTHVEALLVDVSSRKYDRKWYYYCLRRCDWYFLCGELKSDRHPPQRLARTIEEWEIYTWQMRHRDGRFPSLAEQDEFFGVG